MICLTANLPLYASQRWYLIGSFKYRYTAYELDNMVVEGLEEADQNGGIEFHYLSTTLRSVFYGSLFNRPVIYSASLLIDGNENGLERLKGMVGLSFILKQTKRITMSLGAVVFVDPTSQVPFFPAFSYNYHFRNPAWELDLFCPNAYCCEGTLVKMTVYPWGALLTQQDFMLTLIILIMLLFMSMGNWKSGRA